MRAIAAILFVLSACGDNLDARGADASGPVLDAHMQADAMPDAVAVHADAEIPLCSDICPERDPLICGEGATCECHLASAVVTCLRGD